MLNVTDEKSPLRQKLIDLGLLRPGTGNYGPWDRPPMSPELVARVKARYIEGGWITPNNEEPAPLRINRREMH